MRTQTTAHFAVPARKTRQSHLKLLAVSFLALALTGCSVTVADSLLSKGTVVHWLWSEDQKEQAVFSTTDEKVTLHVKFHYNVVANTQTFRVTWYEPSGRPYVAGGVNTPFGNNDSLVVSLKIAGTTAQDKPGRWRVKVHYGAEELLERDFAILEPQ